MTVFLLKTVLSFAQTDATILNTTSNSRDSWSKIKTVDPVTMHLDSARFLAVAFPLRAIDHINSAIELCILNNEHFKEAQAYLALGDIQQTLNQHELAIDNYRKCVSASIATNSKTNKKIRGSFTEVGSQLTLFKACKNMARSHFKLNQFNEALVVVNTALDNTSVTIDKKEKLDAKRLFAEIKLKQGSNSESLNTYKEILDEEKAIGNTEGEIKTLLALGDLYLLEKNDSRASESFTTAKTLADKLNNKDLLFLANEALAGLFRKQKNVEKEIAVRTDISTYNWSTSNMATNASVNQNIEIGNSYLSANQLDKAIQYYDKGFYNTFSNGATVGFSSQNFVTESESIEQSAGAMKTLTNFYLQKGDMVNAKIYFQRYNQLMDSLKQSRKRAFDQAINIGTNFGKNQQRIDLLEKERQLSFKSISILREDKELKDDQLKVRNTIISTLVFCIVFLLIGGYLLSKNYREKRRTNQLLAIKSLRGQMNPHFIFNALNSVNHYISKNDEKAANKYLSDFSKLMRSVMDSSRHDLIPLSDEIETLKLYVELEHARFPDKFNFTFNVEESIDTNDFEIPPMIIQPYIENAVWHGLRYLDNEKGKLEIEFKLHENNLLVNVSDNGIGRKKSAEIKTSNQKSQNSVGMQNIKTRIDLMNQLYAVNIKVSIEDAFPENENTGTKVEIIIPKKIS